MLDRAIAILGVGLALILGLAPFQWKSLPRWLRRLGIGAGIALILVAMVLLLRGEAEQPVVPPDVTLRFVYRRNPAVLLLNQSKTVAREIKWSVIVWNLDLPDRNDPLPIPVALFDFLRTDEAGGPEGVFTTPTVAPLVQAGNRLVGYASVTCPDCARVRQYWVYIVWGEGGWFAELPVGQFVDVSELFKSVPGIKKSPDTWLAQIPDGTRVPIEDRH